MPISLHQLVKVADLQTAARLVTCGRRRRLSLLQSLRESDHTHAPTDRRFKPNQERIGPSFFWPQALTGEGKGSPSAQNATKATASPGSSPSTARSATATDGTPSISRQSKGDSYLVGENGESSGGGDAIREGGGSTRERQEGPVPGAQDLALSVVSKTAPASVGDQVGYQTETNVAISLYWKFIVHAGGGGWSETPCLARLGLIVFDRVTAVF